MHYTKLVFAAMLAASATTLSAPTLAQQAMAEGAVTRTNTYSRGTPGFETVRQFLLQHTTAGQRQSLDDGQAWPASFTVNYVRHIHATADAVHALDLSAPPVPLPTSGSPGDVISVTSCSNGSSESWTYEWGKTGVTYGWVLQSYSYKRVNSCRSQPIGQQ